MSRLLPDGNDFEHMPTPEEFERELVKGLEEYRSLPPHERFNIDNQMHQTTLFVRSGLDMMRENIHEIPPEELDRIRDDFDRFADQAEQTFFSGIVEQYLTKVKTMHYLYVEPTRVYADLVINSGMNDMALDVMATKINSLIEGKN